LIKIKLELSDFEEEITWDVSNDSNIPEEFALALA